MVFSKVLRRQYRPFWVCLTFLSAVFLAACSPELSKSTLDEHERKWVEASISTYSYDLVRYCFCDGSGATISVEVIDGEVASAQYADEVEGVDHPKGLTIREIYDLLHSAVADRDVKTMASFSEEGIIPVDVSIKHATAMDADVAITVSNFRVQK